MLGSTCLLALWIVSQDLAPEDLQAGRELDRRREAVERRLVGGEIEAALAQVRQLLADLEGFGAPAWMRTEVEVLESRGQALEDLSPGAEAAWRTALEHRRSDPEALVAVLEEHLGPGAEEAVWVWTEAAIQALGQRDPALAESRARRAYEAALELPPAREAARARTRMWLGEALLQGGRYDRALEHLEACDRTWVQLDGARLGLYETEALHTTGALGRVLERLKRYPESEARHRAFVAGSRGRFGLDSRQYASGINNLAVHLRDRGEVARAVPLFQENLARKLKLLGAEHATVGIGWLNLAIALRDVADPVRALDAFDQALGIFDAKGPSAALPSLLTRIHMAEILLLQGDIEGAEQRAPEALEDVHPALAAQPESHRRALALHGAIQMALRRHAEAERFLTRAHELTVEHYGADHPMVVRAVADLAALAEVRGQLEPAATLYERNLAADPPGPCPDRSRTGVLRPGPTGGSRGRAGAGGRGLRPTTRPATGGAPALRGARGQSPAHPGGRAGGPGGRRRSPGGGGALARPIALRTPGRRRGDAPRGGHGPPAGRGSGP